MNKLLPYAAVAASFAMSSVAFAGSDPGRAWVYADKPTSGSYTPAKAYAHNPSGEGITVTRPATGRYAVVFAGLASAANKGSNAQVSAYGTDNSYCKVQQWRPQGADLAFNVLCFNAAGKAADSRFTLLASLAAGPNVGKVAFAWANKANSPSYAADARYVSNNGRPVDITRTAAGKYELKFAALHGDAAAGGNVQVSAYGNGPAWCKVGGWQKSGADMIVRIGCFDGGTPADSQFSVLVAPPAM